MKRSELKRVKLEPTRVVIRRDPEQTPDWMKPGWQPVSARGTGGRQDTAAPPAKEREKKTRHRRVLPPAPASSEYEDPRDARYHKETGALRWQIAQREKELQVLPAGKTRDAVERELGVLRAGGMRRYLSRPEWRMGEVRNTDELMSRLRELAKEMG